MQKPFPEHRPDPAEHVAARAALIEQMVTHGVTAGVSFRHLVREVIKANPGFAREEVEAAIRHAEEQLRAEMTSGSARDRSASYRRLLNVARGLYLTFEASEAKAKGVLSLRIVAVEERLAKMAGWDEPERLHIQVTGPSDRLRKALEGFDDEAFVRLAAEEEEQSRTVERAREALGLPPPLAVIAGEE